ncbi:MAG: Type 1 glutamine amidotransferase-like domain-containing protein [Corallococcus sp.]|nr:Type 1 glutamine amidotransferase-like domain-containing protein [Corallococcus sp.]
MTNVLLNYYNFEEDWAKPYLKRYLQNKHVAIIPLAYRDSQAWNNESWQAVYGLGGEKYDKIMAPFFNYGISHDDICWINYFKDNTFSAIEKIRNSDVLFFTGGLPEKIAERLTKMQLLNEIKNFNGVVMGTSAGAMFQLDEYHITPDEDYPRFLMHNGIGLVSGFDLEVHFENTDIQRSCTARAKSIHGRKVYAMWHQGGLLIEDGKIYKMGSVEEF